MYIKAENCKNHWTPECVNVFRKNISDNCGISDHIQSMLWLYKISLMRLINDDVIIASFSSIDSVEPIMCTVKMKTRYMT